VLKSAIGEIQLPVSSGTRFMGSKRPKPERPVSLGNRGISHVGLEVSDLEGSRKFYREILGLKSEIKGPGHVFIRSGSDILVLYTARPKTSDFHFGFRLDSSSDVEEWKQFLLRNRIRIYEDIDEEGHPRSFKFKDPNGYWIEISERPKSRIARAGLRRS
jgi:catechol 2,3-dioxygenase-like lactoylglutathione lyase family enzyme